MTETSRPIFNISEAAEATGKSRRTIGRLLDAGALDGAHRDVDGTWRIPADSLLAAGLHLYEPTPPDPTPPPSTGTPAEDPVVALERELAEWRRRAEVAEAIAEERAAALEDVRAALALAQRMLTPGTVADAAARYRWEPGDVEITRNGQRVEVPTPAAPREPSWWSRWWRGR